MATGGGGERETSKNFTIEAVKQKITDEEKNNMETFQREMAKKHSEKVQEQVYQATAKRVTTEKLKAKEKAEAELEAGLTKINVLKIKRYYEAFPWLDQKIPRMSAKPTLPESAEVLGMIRETLNTQNSLASIFGYCDFGFQMLENMDKSMLPRPCQLDLTGLTSRFREGEFKDLGPLIQEINIEYPWIGSQSLIMRAITTFTRILLQVDYINKHPAAKKAKEMAEKPPVKLTEEELFREGENS